LRGLGLSARRGRFLVRISSEWGKQPVVTVCIIQARIGSARKPGKVLDSIEGQSMLAHVLRRCAAVPGVDMVVCATPQDAANDRVAAEALAVGAQVFRGSEHDVLDRHFQAAQAFGASRVLRVTSDCPLIDPFLLGDMVRLQTESGADLVVNNLPPSWPHGLDAELFTFDWLARAAAEATETYDREHVGPYIRRHPEVVKRNLPCPRPGLSTLRWTVDTDADLAFVRALMPLLPPGPAGWRWLAVLDVVTAHPELSQINGPSLRPDH